MPALFLFWELNSGKKGTQSKGKLVAWYYKSIEKQKNALIGKCFDKRGHKKTRALAIPIYRLLELSGPRVGGDAGRGGSQTDL